MQSMAKGAAADANRPAKLTILSTLKYIYSQNGIKGLYRGVTPRIGLGVWQTICMVSFADYVKAWYVACFPLVLTSTDMFSAGSRRSRGPTLLTLNYDIYCIDYVLTYIPSTWMAIRVLVRAIAVAIDSGYRQ
jgi:hypothetical protein